MTLYQILKKHITDRFMYECTHLHNNVIIDLQSIKHSLDLPFSLLSDLTKYYGSEKLYVGDYYEFTETFEDKTAYDMRTISIHINDITKNIGKD